MRPIFRLFVASVWIFCSSLPEVKAVAAVKVVVDQSTLELTMKETLEKRDKCFVS